MSNKIKVEQDSANIFKDLGFPDEVAEEELLKAQLRNRNFPCSGRTPANPGRGSEATWCETA